MTCVQNEHRLWKRLVKKGMSERTHISREASEQSKTRPDFQKFRNPELTDDREAIRQSLKESRMRRTVRIKTNLP